MKLAKIYLWTDSSSRLIGQQFFLQRTARAICMAVMFFLNGYPKPLEQITIFFERIAWAVQMDDNFFERIAQAIWADDNDLAVYLQ